MPNRARCHPRYGSCRSDPSHSGRGGNLHGDDFAREPESPDTSELYNGRNCEVGDGLYVKRYLWSGRDRRWGEVWGRDP